jgi:hypothetical protein
MIQAIRLPLAERRIIVVEDDPILKIGLESILKGAGAQLVSSLDHRLDVALLDLLLEHGVTSVPIAQTLSRRDVPFLFYTGLPEASLAGIRARFPQCTIIAKPSQPADIIDALAGLLIRRHEGLGGHGAPAA